MSSSNEESGCSLSQLLTRGTTRWEGESPFGPLISTALSIPKQGTFEILLLLFDAMFKLNLRFSVPF